MQSNKDKFGHKTKCDLQKPESVLKNETQKILCDFEIQTDSWIPTRKTRVCDNFQETKTYPVVDFTVPADHEMKTKESEKNITITWIFYYLDIIRELWNIEVMEIPIVIGVLGMVSKG